MTLLRDTSCVQAIKALTGSEIARDRVVIHAVLRLSLRVSLYHSPRTGYQ